MAITLTDALRAHAKEHFGVADDAADEVVQKAIGDKLVSGDLTPADFARLSAAKAPSISDIISKSVAEAVAKALPSNGHANGNGHTDNGNGSTATITIPMQDQVNPMKFFAQAASRMPDLSHVRVKEAVERYDGTSKRALYPTKSRTDGIHPMGGRPASYAGEPLFEPSERDLAIAGAWFKMSMWKSSDQRHIPPKLRPTEHDVQLIDWALEHSKWAGFIKPDDGIYSGPCDDDTSADDPRVVSRRKLTDTQRMWLKTLLDDSQSGGIEIAPIEFDNAVVTVPVLYGELWPYVNVVTVTRGRRMKGGSLINPTFNWGPPEGSAITLFNTQAMVSAFDTPIFNMTAAILIGLDFLEDSPTTIGDIIVKKYGEKYLEQLDFVVANGDGVTQPLGFLNTSSPKTASADNQTNGPPTVSDYELLYFAVQKQFRNEAGAQPAFVSSDTSYQRARSIAVSPTDQRRVFGMDHASYRLLNVRYAVQNDIVNNKIAFVMLNRYRAYRRLGLTVRMETAGATLALANERLIVVRSRLGGQQELGASVAVITNGQT
jgi:HK97 family phage major capsid protein